MELSTAGHVGQLLGGFYNVFFLHAMARLELADHLAAGPLTIAQLAAACDAREETLERFVHGLVAIGVVTRTSSGDVALTDAGQWLRGDVPGGYKHSALMCGDPSFLAAWTAAADAVRTGTPAWDSALGEDFFESLDQNPRVLEQFQLAMTGFPYINDLVLDAYDFSAATTVMDLGGGTGSLAKAIVAQHPGVDAIVLDRPSVIAASEAAGRTEGTDRVRWVAGDFRAPIPKGADHHVFRFVLSDWNDEEIAQIFRRCYAALPDGGRLVVIENLQQPTRPELGASLDLMMLVLTGGRCRSAAEYRDLMTSAGFVPDRTVAAPGNVTVVVAVKPSGAVND